MAQSYFTVTFLLILFYSTVSAVPKSDFYPYGLTKNDFELAPNDEGSSEALVFSTPFVYYEVNHKKAYVNVNGLITFDTDVAYFINQELIEFPHSMIAVFYADIDTHVKHDPELTHGNIYYRLTNDSSVLRRATQTIRGKFSDAKTFDAKSCLVTTWDDVGYFDSKHDKGNTFQVVLCQGERQSYAEFLYADNEVNWIRSDGKDINLQDAPAQAGFISNDGRSFNLMSSGREDIAEIFKQSNIDIPGVFLYRISGETVVGPEHVTNGGSLSYAAAQDVEDETEDEDADYYENNAADYANYDNIDEALVKGASNDGELLKKVKKVNESTPEPETPSVGEPENAAAEPEPEVSPTVEDVTQIAGEAVAEPEPEPEPTFAPVPEPEAPAVEDLPVTPEATATHAIFPVVVEEEPEQLPPCPDDPYHGVCPPDCTKVEEATCTRCECPREEPTAVPESPVEVRPYEPYQPPRSGIPVENNGDQYAATNGRTCAEAGVTGCHAQATCVDQTVGYCCQCSYGYFGNGVECLADGEPQRINGRFSGKINGVNIGETDLHTYVVTSDGRAYTALSQISPQFGRPLLLLSTIGGVMGWLFAKPSSERAYNGFMLSGGLFNRTIIVHIGDKHTVTISQDFSGKDIFHYFKAKVFVTGTLPQIPDDATVEFGEYSEEYNRVGPGIVKSYSSKTIDVNSESQGPTRYQLTIDQTIRYNECSFKKFDKEALTILKIERSYVVYDPAEQIVRYASGNSVEIPGDSRDDPCREGIHDCQGQHMTCARDGNRHKCLCLDGYDLIFTNDLDTRGVCVDLNECTRNLHRCDPNAHCHNTEGAYTCICKPGFRGTGYKCINNINECGPLTCDRNADCMPLPGEVNTTECVCKPGYYGDGIRCSEFDVPVSSGPRRPPKPLVTTEPPFPSPKPFGPPHPIGDQSCADLACDRNADCVTLSDGNLGCLCKPGFDGDGYTCSSGEEAQTRHPIGPTCSSHEECHRYGACIYNEAVRHYQCQCRTPYSGDGRHCFLEAETCDRAHNCDANADCVYRQTEIGAGYICRCKSGFSGDGYACQPLRTSAPVQCNVLNTCSPHAQCLYANNGYVCRCNSGYKGDGYKCELEAAASERRCRSQDDCHSSGHCVNRDGRDEYICECLPGFKGNGVTSCEPADQCSPADANTCGQNAACSYDEVEQAYICKCQQGYLGDGRQCTRADDRSPIPYSCREDASICHARATCTPDYVARVYRCVCNTGYRGDGQTSCEAERALCDSQNICDSNARCITAGDGRLNCICNSGFEGDGLYCRAAPDCFSTPSLCDRNAECVPENQRYVCRCKAGYRGSGQRCSSEDDLQGRKLIFAQGMSLVQRGVLQDDRGRQLVVVPYQIAVGVDYDCKDEKIYWSDISGHAIRSANVDGSNLTLLFEKNLESPEGIAVDWASRNIYYVDSQLDVIGVATLDGKYSYSIIKDGLVNPRALALDLYEKKLYYSDWFRERPTIGRANLDGSNREVFISEELGLPNGLAVLHRHRELCWADAGKHRLECIKLNGSGRRVVYAPLGYPFGLTIQNEETFYWTDWDDTKIHSVSVYGGSHATYVPSLGGSGRLYGLVSISTECPPGDSPCAVNNGGCKHICLPDGRGSRVCVCPENLNSDSDCNVLNGSS